MVGVVGNKRDASGTVAKIGIHGSSVISVQLFTRNARLERTLLA